MTENLFLGIVASAVGTAYIVYGRRQAKYVPLLAGISLCLFTFFIDSWMWLCVVGVALLAAPFLSDL
jgi:hypothetical protein